MRLLWNCMIVGLLALLPSLSSAQVKTEGAITITVQEYERLKELEEGDKRKQYWKMSFEQILEKENNNYAAAWDKYDFWVLRNIELAGTVDDSSVRRLIGEISTLNQISKTEPITLTINSGGGGVLSGLSLVNAMELSTAPVNTVCDGFAFSMAAVTFIAGSVRTANEGCLFMIHEVAVGAGGGQTREHVKWTETVIDVEALLVDIMSRRTGLDYAELQTLMEYESFWTAEEMVRLGFADVSIHPIHLAPERDIPEDLLPLTRMRENYNQKLQK